MEVKIRAIKLEDANDLNEMRQMPGVFETILGLPSERLDGSIGFIQSMDHHHHHLVAEVNHKVIGIVSLVVDSNPRRSHVANFGIMIHKDYQNQGIGSQLISAILDLADHWLMIKRIELDVFADNERAIHLYEKMGFVIEGKKTKSSIKNGEYADEYFMARVR